MANTLIPVHDSGFGKSNHPVVPNGRIVGRSADYRNEDTRDPFKQTPIGLLPNAVGGRKVK